MPDKEVKKFVPKFCREGEKDAQKHLLEYKWNGQYFRCQRKNCDYTGWILSGRKYPLSAPCNISAFFDLSAKAVGGKGLNADGSNEAYYSRENDKGYLERVAQNTTPEYQAKILSEIERAHFMKNMKEAMS